MNLKLCASCLVAVAGLVWAGAAAFTGEEKPTPKDQPLRPKDPQPQPDPVPGPDPVPEPPPAPKDHGGGKKKELPPDPWARAKTAKVPPALERFTKTWRGLLQLAYKAEWFDEQGYPTRLLYNDPELVGIVSERGAVGLLTPTNALVVVTRSGTKPEVYWQMEPGSQLIYYARASVVRTTPIGGATDAIIRVSRKSGG